MCLQAAAPHGGWLDPTAKWTGHCGPTRHVQRRVPDVLAPAQSSHPVALHHHHAPWRHAHAARSCWGRGAVTHPADDPAGETSAAAQR